MSDDGLVLTAVVLVLCLTERRAGWRLAGLVGAVVVLAARGAP